MTDRTHTLARLYRPVSPETIPMLFATVVFDKNLVLVRRDVWENRDENITRVLQRLDDNWWIN